MTSEQQSLLLAAVVVITLVVLGVGCGGNSGSSSASSGQSGSSARKAIAEFLQPKSPKNKYVRFGTEAPPTEREAASIVLGENFKARQESDFATQCASLAKATIEEVAAPNKGPAAQAACPDALRKLAEPLKSTEKARADTLAGPIAALRIKGTAAYALFHGKGKKDYAMPMKKENGAWKVRSLVADDLG